MKLHATMTKTTQTDVMLIAPCGMNCRICRAYARQKNPCPGCRGDNSLKTKTRVECRIKNCGKIASGKAKYCFTCDSFPCDRLKHLDERYRTKYRMSMIENLENISKRGIRHFVSEEKERWTCPECGKMIRVREPECLYCGYKWR